MTQATAQDPTQKASDKPQVDKSGQRVQKMFAEIAPKYDLMNHLLSANVDRWWRSKTISKLSPGPSDKLLDVCTGTGDLAIGFWKYMKSKAASGENPSVMATDFCKPMLDIGIEKGKKQKCTGLHFQEADSMNLPFEANQFDLVTVAFGLRNVAKTEVGLSEMSRVCRPGGRVAILEFTMPRLWPLSSLYKFYFLSVLPKVGQWFSKNDSSAYNYLPESVNEFPQYEQLSEMMQDAGMKDVTFHPMTFGLATLYIGTKK